MEFKTEAVEFAEMNSNEKAAKKFRVWVSSRRLVAYVRIGLKLPVPAVQK